MTSTSASVESEGIELQPAAIVMARLGSSRLPGKVLADIGGKPLLELVLDRVRSCSAVREIVVAVSDRPDDDPLVAWCDDHDTRCHRGPLEHVARRALDAARSVGARWFFRVNADSPFVAIDLFPAAIHMAQSHPVDLVSNLAPRVLPPGASVELVRTDALATEIDHFDHSDAEHVTRYFYRHPDRVRRRHLPAVGYDVPEGLRLVVDDAADLDRVRRVVARMDRPPWTYSLHDVIRMTLEAA